VTPSELEELQRLRAQVTQYKEAMSLWDALDVEDGQQVVEAVVIAKVFTWDPDKNLPPSMSIAATDGMDWIQQYGMLHAAIALQNGLPWENTEEEG